MVDCTSDANRRQFLAAALAAGCGSSVRADVQKAAAKRAFRLGLVTYNIAASWDLVTLIDICDTLHLAPVELRTTHKHGVEPALSKNQRVEVRRRFTDAGVELWGCGTTCEFHSPEKAVVQRNIETCKRFIDLVKDLGGKGVKVRPNDLPSGISKEKTLEQIGKALAECGRAAAGANVEVWLEVHGGHGAAHPPNVKKMMEHCGHPSVGVTWNSNDSDIKDGSVAEYFHLLEPWIRSCHINELTSGYPYRELFKHLREMRYDRATLIEIQGAPDLASACRLLRYYKALWEEWTH